MPRAGYTRLIIAGSCGWVARGGFSRHGIAGTVTSWEGGPMRHPFLSIAATVGATVTLGAAAQGAAAQPSAGPLSLASGPSPFATCTSGLDPGSPPGTNYVNAEDEPSVAVDPIHPS